MAFGLHEQACGSAQCVPIMSTHTPISLNEMGLWVKDSSELRECCTWCTSPILSEVGVSLSSFTHELTWASLGHRPSLWKIHMGRQFPDLSSYNGICNSKYLQVISMFFSVSQKFKILRCCQLNKSHLVAGLSPRAASLHHLIEGIHFLISECYKAY